MPELSKEETAKLLDHMSQRKKDGLVTSLMISADIHESNAAIINSMYEMCKEAGFCREDSPKKEFMDEVAEVILRAPSDVHIERSNAADFAGIVAKDISIISLEQQSRAAMGGIQHALMTFGRCLDSCDSIKGGVCNCGWALVK